MPSSARSIKAKRQSSAEANRLHLVLPKPRNPLVALAAARKAGEHKTSAKTERQQQARQMRDQLKGL
jgi:hypothetical protein